MDTITTPAAVQSPPETSIQHSAQVSLTSRSPASVVHLVQYDATVPIIAVALTANGQPYTVPSGAAVNVRLAKPDGTYVYNPAYGLSDDSQTAYIAVTVQMTVCSGRLAPVVEVVIDGGVAATGFFILDIDHNPIPEDAIASTDEYQTIQQLAAQVQAAAKIVSDNEVGIQYIADNHEEISSVAANGESITTVGQSIGNVNAVATNIADVQTAAQSIEAIQKAPTAATNAAASATLAESWAVGGTGTREGENTNNAQYWAGQAQTIAQGALGWYESESALQSAHPTGSNGQWAIIGSTDTIWTWDSDTSAWVNSGNQVDLSNYYTKSQTDGIVGWLYKATFDLDGWTGSGSVSQTAVLTPVDGGPPVTSGSTLLACIGIDSTLPQETKDAMAGPASDIAGAEKALGAGTISVTLESAPDVDVELYFYVKQGVSPAVPPLDPVVGGGGMKLLWTNPAVGQSYSTGTVNIDLSGYDAVLVTSQYSTTDTSIIEPIFILIGQTGLFFNTYGAGPAPFTFRKATVSKTGVSFAAATVAETLIPYQIFGVKF